MTKKRRIIFPAWACAAVGSFLLPGCAGPKQEKAPVICNLVKDTVAYLQKGSAKPSCKVRIDYAYLKPASETDSLSLSIDSTLQRAIFAQANAPLPPGVFVETVALSYINSYHTDVKSLFEADMRNGMNAEDVPGWYNYEYEISTRMQAGRDSSVWNYTITAYRYTGGAHPGTNISCLNIDRKTGKVLSAADVFRSGSEAEICTLILGKLLEEASKRKGQELASLGDLQEAGILQDTDLYVPGNFLLERDGVTFIYNQYEIAPYSEGIFNLTVPYEELNGLLNIQPTE